MKKITQIIDSGLSFLANIQCQNGSFLSDSCPMNTSAIVQKYYYQTTFFTSFIIEQLAILKDFSVASEISHAAVLFLYTQKQPNFAYNYWSKDDATYESLPYPDDLDDTCLAWAALYGQSDLVSGEDLAAIIHILTAQETEVGGPYKTWLVSADIAEQWFNIDLAVNANIAYFLSVLTIQVAPLTAYIDGHIRTNTIRSSFYPRRMPILFCIARGYRGVYKDMLVSYVYAELKRALEEGHVLDCALAMRALFALGEEKSALLSDAHELLIQTQQENGGWKSYPFCIDPARNKEKYVGGSEAFTTAVCLRALYEYLSMQEKKVTNDVVNIDEKEQKIIAYIDEVSTRISAVLAPYDPERIFSDILKKLQKDREIFLLNSKVAESIHDADVTDMSSLVSQLTDASVYGWIGYRIFDDIVDEKKYTDMLPLANVCMRKISQIYETLGKDNIYIEHLFHRCMDEMDAALAQELIVCRLKENSQGKWEVPSKLPKIDFDILASRSIGHAIGPLVLHHVSGATAEENKKFEQFFRHYLIARQLNDDAHDFADDLFDGRLNAVSIYILSHMKDCDSSDTERIETMRREFWYTHSEHISNTIIMHCEKALQNISQCTKIIDKTFYERMIATYRHAAEQTIYEQKKMVSFLQKYNPS